VGKPVGERPIGRPRPRWVDDTEMDLREIGLDWFGSGQRQVESFCECSYESAGSIQCWESVRWLNDVKEQ
jgi:hypothetical protein